MLIQIDLRFGVSGEGGKFVPEIGVSRLLEKLCPSQRDFFMLLLGYASFLWSNQGFDRV